MSRVWGDKKDGVRGWVDGIKSRLNTVGDGRSVNVVKNIRRLSIITNIPITSSI